jgi:K+/H+ antiporter YhaU regulatory subunit KhtT
MGVRLVAFSATIGGMCVFALMIGIISDTIGEKVDELKKGKSRVIEKGHTLLLGWTDMSLPIIQEIALANESEGGGVIVVLSKIDKDEMEAELAAAKSSHESPLDLKGTKVLFRSGNTLAEPDLFKASAHTARAIVALSDGFDPDEADSRMVRQVLSLRSILQRNPQGGDGVTLAHVVCELRDVDNEHLIKMVGKDMVETVCAHDIIGRIMIQCARATGLAYILENLIGFDGHEFYLKEWPKLHRKAFGQLLTRFDDAVPVGIKHNGKVILSPSDDYIIQKGDEILVLAEDDDSYDVNDGSFEVDVKVGLPKAADKHEAKPEVLLFCGWRRDLADMIKVPDTRIRTAVIYG